VILKQSPVWAQLITVTIVSVTAILIGWAYFAKIEEAIPAQGKLEATCAVQPVQAPVGGVVAGVHVEEGQLVEEGDVLITFDQTAAIAEIRGDMVEAAWGNQIRNYVFHPYQMVKDLRTNVETTAIDSVMDGELSELIEAYLRADSGTATTS
jgi:multidrug resistance efflux pump